jgi:hypothetical protein
MQLKLLALAAASLVLPTLVHAGSFATAVVEYNPGSGYSAKYTNTAAVLGPPSSTDSGGEAIDPFYPEWQPAAILALGAGGSVTVMFDQPILNLPEHPFGRDFTIFGNSFFVDNSSDEATGIYSDACQATIWASSDGLNYYELNPALAPQLNDLFPTDGEGNFLLPVNPAISNFDNLTLEQIRSLYNGSGGGTSYALSWAVDTNGNSVYLMDARFIRVQVSTGEAFISSFAAVSNTIPETVIAEDFYHNPMADGWNVFGDAGLFSWNSASNNMQVTWDSSQPNSYFYHFLGGIMGKADDFSMAFDLLLNDYTIGVNPNQPATFELASGFFNYAEATSTNFFRGGYPSQPDLAEFDFFQWDNYFSTNSVDPTFVDSANDFANNGYGTVELPTGVVMRVTMNYTASNEIGVLTVTTNGAPLLPPVTVDLTDDTYGTFGDFHLDTFAVESYSDAMAYGSLLAHGTIGNILIVGPPPPVTNLQILLTNGISQIQFTSRANWNYVLQTSTNLQSWSPEGGQAGGTGGVVTMSEGAPLQQQQFYRVSAQRAD